MNFSVKILNLFSSSKALLNLLEHALGQLYDFQLTETIIQSEPINQPTVDQSLLSASLDCLIEGTHCLMELVGGFIERTMHSRVAQLDTFLKDITNSLELAHRLSEWQTVVQSAHLFPADNPPMDPEYKRLRHLTDDHLKSVCLQTTL